MTPRFLTKADVVSVNKWLTARRAPTVLAKDLPSISFIIPGVAVAGIRCCEGRVGIFDSLVTNPIVTAKTRQRALNTLFKFIMAYPDFDRILGFTTDSNSLVRALKHGFKQLPYAVLSYSKEQ